MTADTTVLFRLVRQMLGGSIGMAPAACHISHIASDEVTLPFSTLSELTQSKACFC